MANQRTPTPPAFSKLFALHWFSHQPCLLNQGPPSSKTANYAQMRCHPVPFLSPPMFPFSTLLCLVSILFFPAPSDLFFQVTVRWENALLHLWPSFSVCVTLTQPPEERSKAFKGFLFGNSSCNCS